MSGPYRCHQCGAELPPDAPQGLCPNCLLKAGFGTQATGGTSQTGSESADADSFGARFVPPTPAELARYFPELEILELLGRGGMGVVYKARQKRLDRVVALKILSPNIGRDPAFAERFAREARAMAMLSHPHIVAVHDFGQTAMTSEGANVPSPASERRDGREGGASAGAPLYYFIMEYVDGLNLRRLLDTGKLAPEEALAIVPQICDALQYAHDHGVVHRDIKPENVLLDKEGHVKIADFGIAKLLGKEGRRPEDLTLTDPSHVMGTPQYMAPEQIERPLEVDHRADIYSLGVVFYQMLTGELPIGRFAPPSKKVQIDVRLDEVVLRALEKEPERRYQQASEIKTRVETIVTTPNADAGGSATRPPDSRMVRTANAASTSSIEHAQRQVKGPAIALLVAGLISVLTSPMVVLFWGMEAVPQNGVERLAVQTSAERVPPIALFLAGLLSSIAPSILMIVAAVKMKRLEAYGLAIAASILAIILLAPTCLIGLPIGIWALVVLSQRDVRAAFRRTSGTRPGAPSPTATANQRRIGMAALVVCLAAILSTPLLAAVAGRTWSVWSVLMLVLSVITIALVLGIAGWRTATGKAAVTISAVFLFGALVFLGVVVAYEAPKIHRDFGGWPSVERLDRRSETTNE
jgi:serine/threonine protein kinase